MTIAPSPTPQGAPDTGSPAKGVFFIAASQFGIAFSFNCIMSFMPFYLLRISPYPEKETMVWIGLIMGSTSMVAAVAAPFWGSLSARIRPKLLFEVGIFCNGVIFCLLGFTDSLPLILGMRLFQGVLGGVSTIGLVLIAGAANGARLPGYMSLFQNSITAGQLLGPPLGAYAVAVFGYHAPFVISPVITFAALAYCHRHVLDVPGWTGGPKTGKRVGRGILWGWALTIVGTIHLTFLPSILPQLLETFQLTGEVAVSTAGTIMMVYMASATLGNYVLVRLSGRWGIVRLLTVSCLSAAALQVLLYLSEGVYVFTLIRMLQTAAIAAVFPLVISTFVGEARGATLGFLNSARFVGNAVGPMMATTILAHADLLTLYLTIAGLTLAAWWAFVRHAAGGTDE
jgi:MFS transporter, DHA1 family, multidrug resistance protein